MKSKRQMQSSILTLVTLTSFAWRAVFAYAASEAEQAWSLLATAEVREVTSEGEWKAVKTFPDVLRAAREDFKVSGFYVPIQAQGYVTSFILVESPASCPFCGDSGYGPVLEVTMKRPMPDLPEFSQITVLGRLEFNEASDTFQMYQLVDANLISTGAPPPELELPLFE